MPLTLLRSSHIFEAVFGEDRYLTDAELKAMFPPGNGYSGMGLESIGMPMRINHQTEQKEVRVATDDISTMNNRVHAISGPSLKKIFGRVVLFFDIGVAPLIPPLLNELHPISHGHDGQAVFIGDDLGREDGRRDPREDKRGETDIGFQMAYLIRYQSVWRPPRNTSPFSVKATVCSKTILTS
jgi:hypothetical protein